VPLKVGLYFVETSRLWRALARARVNAPSGKAMKYRYKIIKE